MNGLGIMSVMLNRTTGQTETWGTVQLKIMIQTVNNMHQGSKRMIENLCNLWMRVNGIQGVCKFTHNPVDWESEKVKTEVALLMQQLHRRAEEYQWESKEVAAKDSMGISKLENTTPPTYTEYVKNNLKAAQGTGESNV